MTTPKKPKRKTKNAPLTAKSLDEFLGLVRDIRNEWDFTPEDIADPWFRGQQRKHWKLIPNITRIGCFNRSDEDDIREEFAKRAPALSRYETLPTNEWDLYFLMQHYGAPTRLLDWTESPAIALYFAVRDNQGYYDSAVWMLDPYGLNKLAIGKREVLAPSAQGVNPKDKRLVLPWLPARWDRKKRIPRYPLAVFPTHIARRISSQKSCFTVHGTEQFGFAKFEGKERNAILRKIIIPGHAVPRMRRDLRHYGMDETTIFPDLEGLGRALVTTYRDNKPDSPHRDVYVRLRPSKLDRTGVGVFAIKKIPRNTKVFADENEEVCWMDVAALPKRGPLRTLYDDFSIIKSKLYGCPTSFNRLTPAWFMNESKASPNTRCDENYDFYTLRDVLPGEELTVHYKTFSDYPKKSKA
jgi:hypothetical protein